MAQSVWRGLRRVFAPAAHGTTLQAQIAHKPAFLREIDIFRDLLPEDFTWLAQTTRMITVSRGGTVYHQEDRAEGLFLLKRGRVRLYRLSTNGRKLELAVLEPGTFFGEMPLLAERMRNASAEALEDATLCVLSRADIERLVLRRPQVALRMLDVLSRRLAECEVRLEELAYRSVPARVALVLLRLGAQSGDVVEGMTHQELGDMVGAHRETVTKVLDSFEASGLIELARQRIRIVDRPGLARLLET